MRHRNRLHKLGKPADQRKALLRSLATNLIKHGQITVTKERARAVKAEVERLITLAKDGSLSARRQVAGYLYEADLVKALFDKVGSRYADRAGGYTRIVRTIRRRGDGAEMAVIEFV